jgi:hypothetical protein
VPNFALLLLLGCPADPTDVVPPDQVAPDVLINEVQSKNQSTQLDPANTECPEYDDWIEILNTTDTEQDLSGLHLADESGERYDFPSETLASGARFMVWADDQPQQGPNHAPFKLSKDGELLQLMFGDTTVDEVLVPELADDVAWARYPDASSTWIEREPTPDEANSRQLPDDPCFAVDGFDDHGYPCIPDREGFFALAGSRTDLSVVKFDVFNFDDDATRRVSFVDTDFYKLHDQYYIYTVLNGQPFGSLDKYPTYAGDFAEWADLEAFARVVDLEALFEKDQLRWTGDRLFSRYFYDEINGADRELGVGTLVYRDATETREELWAFELEFGDDIVYEELVVYFETLEAAGPPEFANLQWLIRSTKQEDTALEMEAQGLPYSDRLVRYTDLAVQGEVEVYNPGMTGGPVHMVRAGQDGLEDANSRQIVVLGEVPDYLPPCAGLITSVPQTPLSHISLLARSRGIPNAYVAGITEDPAWDAWRRVHAKVVIEATPDHELQVEQMSPDDWSTWTDLLELSDPVLQTVDPETLPWSIDLEAAADMLTLRPEVGGKAAGMRQLLVEPTLDPPDSPLGITIRGYHAHIDQIDWLKQLLDAHPFKKNSDPKIRYLVLEGQAAFDTRYTGGTDAVERDAFLDGHPIGERAGDLARGDGLRGYIDALPMPAEVEEALLADVEAQFAYLPVEQGLRFRSSSNVEDIEGFNGAGLYTSHTGFWEPGGDQLSVSDAIVRVWASYWNSEAFEERNGAGIDHLQGAMGVLVHPRFDDEYERSNHVLTVSLLPDGTWEMLANAQIGNISVANPPTTCPAVLPEQSRITSAGVERLSESTEVASGEQVLTDDQLMALFEQSKAVTSAWLAAENEPLSDTHRRSVLTLDLESREMDAGWPLGSSSGARLVLKQARSLEPSTSHLPSDITELPVPQDVLARALAVDSTTCAGDTLEYRVVSVKTDPFQLPDVGYGNDPFVATVDLVALEEIAALGWAAGDGLSFDSVDADAVLTQSGRLTLDWLEGSFTADGDWTLEVDGSAADGGPVICTNTVLWSSSDNFLLSLLY